PLDSLGSRNIAIGELPTISDQNLLAVRARKRLLLIRSERIFDSRVERGIPSLPAAPDGPATRPPLVRRASSTSAFSCAASAPNRPTLFSAAEAPESQLSS